MTLHVYELNYPIDEHENCFYPEPPYLYDADLCHPADEKEIIDEIMDFLENDNRAYHDSILREDIWFYSTPLFNDCTHHLAFTDYRFYAKLKNNGTTFMFSNFPQFDVDGHYLGTI
jgi:hypothetical protein